MEDYDMLYNLLSQHISCYLFEECVSWHTLNAFHWLTHDDICPLCFFIHLSTNSYVSSHGFVVSLTGISFSTGLQFSHTLFPSGILDGFHQLFMGMVLWSCICVRLVWVISYLSSISISISQWCVRLWIIMWSRHSILALIETLFMLRWNSKLFITSYCWPSFSHVI